MNLKKIILGLFLLCTLFLGMGSVHAQDSNKTIIHFFYGKGCPHCAKEEEYLTILKEKYPDIEVKEYEVWHDETNQKLLENVVNKLDAKISGVPLTVIGNRYVSGFLDDTTSGSKIEELVKCHQETKCEDVVLGVTNGENTDNDSRDVKENIPETIRVPFFGEINIKNWSVPVISIVLGTLDGFNPCAMWVLVFLITLLLATNDIKRMWILGGIFLFASAAVYFLVLSTFLNLLMFIGFLKWVRIIIGIVALFGGYINLKEYSKNKEAVCAISKNKRENKIVEGLKRYAKEKNFWVAVGGIVVLAFSINMVEAVCSAGIPVIYTQILSISELPKWQYYLNILIYIIFYMLDDIIVFIIAMVTLRLTTTTSKYTKYAHLIGGTLMLIIGVLLIFKPEWLMFG